MGAWARRAGRNLLLLAGVALVASLGLFTAIRLIPGDGLEATLKHPDPEVMARLRAQLGLDRPLPEQYAAYLANFATGDWGQSLVTRRAVREEFAAFFPATLELALAALALGAAGGVVLALAAQTWRQAWLARTLGALGSLGLTVPIFWIGLLLILAGGPLGLPGGGRWAYALAPPPAATGFLTLDCLLAGRPDLLPTALAHLCLPVLTLSLYPAALVCGVLQGRLQEPRLQSLVRALRAQGTPPWRVWYVHVLRLMGAPLATLLGTHFGALLGGAVLTETVFSWPGLGTYLVRAVLNRDVFVVQHSLLAVVLLAFAAVSAGDLLAFALDPRLRDAEARRAGAADETAGAAADGEAAADAA